MVRHTPVETAAAPAQAQSPSQPGVSSGPGYKLEPDVHLWVDEQIFEEDVRAVLRMMRPNTRERLAGWKEYRTGGAHFRVTVSWDDEFQITSPDTNLAVPHMTEVMETLLVGSCRGQDEQNVKDEFELYRSVVRELYQRLEQRETCYE